MEEEIWKDIEGYEGSYQVSNLGRVRSLDRIIHYLSCYGKPSQRLAEGKLIRPGISHDNYMSVALTFNGVSKSFSVHRLVASAFIPNPNNLPQVNHKDENPANNRADNLEWCTAKYNSNYGTRLQKLSESKKGMKHCPESIQHMKEAKRGSKNPMYGRTQSVETRSKIQNALKGIKRTPEQCRRNSEAHKGKKPWNYGMQTRPIVCLDVNITFQGSKDAAAWLKNKVSPEAVEYAAKHVACCAGHIFVYADNVPEDRQKYIDYCYTHSIKYKHLASQPVYSLD